MAKTVQTEESENQKLYRYWADQLGKSDTFMRKWRERCKRIVRRYRRERLSDDTAPPAASSGIRQYAILYANVETLKPAVYSQTPQPVVSRRFKDEDPVGRIAAEIQERALSFAMDAYDFDAVMEACRDDLLLFAMGQTWARYVPHVAAPQQRQAATPQADGPQITEAPEAEGEAAQVVYEQALCDHVAYNCWGYNAAKQWSDVWFVWRLCYMDRTSLVKRFGPIGRRVPLGDQGPDDTTRGPEDDASQRDNMGAVYEVWDKRSGDVIWFAHGVGDLLDRRPDPLGLSDFFPCPPPLLGVVPPDKLIPVPDFVYYEDQVQELDQLTAKIGLLTDALKVVGIYAGEEKQLLSQLFSQPTNQMIPVESMASLTEKGGLGGIVEWFPIAQVVKALKACFEARAHILDDIYGITGISDIMRGDTDANETYGAQRIKNQRGSLRVRDRQKAMARFCRDTLRLKAEIIAGKFSQQTLAQMTGVKLLTAQQKQIVQQVQQAVQQAAQQGQQVPLPPEVQAWMPLADKPSWDEVMAVLRNDAARSFRIDVETDSTIEPDDGEEKARRTEFLTALSGLLSAALPVLQTAPWAAPLIAESVKFLTRGFRVGAEMEEVIDKVFDQVAQMPPAQPEQKPGPPPPDPADQQAKVMTAQARVMDAQTNAQRAQAEAQQGQAELSLEALRADLERVRLQMDQYVAMRDPQPQAVAVQ